MATTTFVPTDAGIGKHLSGIRPIDWASDDIKIMLLDAAPNPTTIEFVSTCRGDEVTGTNWAADGVALASKTATITTGPVVKWDAADVSVGTVTLTGAGATHCVVYKDTGSDATSPVLLTGVITGSFDPDAGTAAITFASNGLIAFGL